MLLSTACGVEDNNMQTNLIDTEEFLSYKPGSMKVCSTKYKKVETGGNWWWRDGMRYKCSAAENGSYIGQIVHYPEYENSELKKGGYATVTYVITKGGTKQRVENGTISDPRVVSGSPSYTIEVPDAEEIFLITKSDRTLDMGTIKEFEVADSYELFNSLISDIEAVCANEDYMTEGFLDYDNVV